MPRRAEPSPYTAQIGAQIRALRLSKGMSLRELADLSHTSKGHLSSVEHGLAAITVETVERIARGLGASPLYLFASSEDDAYAQIANLLLAFDPQELKRLHKEIQARHKALSSTTKRAQRQRA